MSEGQARRAGVLFWTRVFDGISCPPYSRDSELINGVLEMALSFNLLTGAAMGSRLKLAKSGQGEVYKPNQGTIGGVLSHESASTGLSFLAAGVLKSH